MDNGDTGTVKRSRGRPKGSKNKPKQVKKGRPKGSKSGYTVSEKALAQRRANVDNITLKIPNTPEGLDYNTRLINHVMQIQEIRQQAVRSDLNSLKSCFFNYLKLCQANGFPVQNLAAYSAMGFDPSTFCAWAKSDDPDRREFASFVKSTCALFRESMVSDGKINPVIGIFWQRNFDGLRNDTEQVQAINEQDDSEFSNKSYKEKYKNLIGE